MVSTFTANKSIEQPANGDYVNTWDVPVNADWGVIDIAFGGLTTLNATGASGTVNLTATQYRPPTIVITGTLTADVIYQLPSGVGGFWTVYNNTTGAHTVTLKSATGAGTTVALTQGVRTLVACDQTNVFLMSTAAAVAGGSNTQVQYNSSGVLAGSANLTFSGTVLALTGAMRFQGASSGYMGFQGPNAGGNVVWTLPAADGSAGQFLSTNGAGTLSWAGTSAGVSSITFGTTGLTPSAASGGAVSVSGTLNTSHGGTGSTSAATGTGGVVLASSPTLSSPTLNNPTFSGTITGGAATTTVAGLVKLSTATLLKAGTDNTAALTAKCFGDLVATSAAITAISGGDGGVALSPSFTPVRVQAYLVCTSATHNWQVGDIVYLSSDGTMSGAGSSGLLLYNRGGAIYYIVGINNIAIVDPTTGGSQFNPTGATFSLYVQAWGY